MGFLPSQEVISFSRAHEWNPEVSGEKLAPILNRSWFGQTLLPRLRIRAHDSHEAIRILADRSAAPPEFGAELGMILEYLSVGGAVLIENGRVQQNASLEPGDSTTNERPGVGGEIQRQAASAKAVALPSVCGPTDGAVQFNISVSVDMSEFSEWAPERITAFFAGIAKVLSAKGGGSEEGRAFESNKNGQG